MLEVLITVLGLLTVLDFVLALATLYTSDGVDRTPQNIRKVGGTVLAVRSSLAAA